MPGSELPRRCIVIVRTHAERTKIDPHARIEGIRKRLEKLLVGSELQGHDEGSEEIQCILARCAVS